MAAPTPFDLAGPLPRGRVTLEASAGTGKTYAIVGLAARYLAEGVCRADELLVVTFARSATRELRTRLLARLHRSLEVLTAAVAGDLPDAADPVDRVVCDAPAEELAVRRDRLARAVADIDLATVTTLHAFGAEALGRIGAAATGELLEDTAELAADIAGDLYLRAVAEDPAAGRLLPWFDLNGPQLAAAGMAVDPVDVAPVPGLTSRDGVRAWLATEAHREAVARTRRQRLHTHDDLLGDLARRLADPVDGPAAAQRAGARFRVGLVDEFQDTDPTQWAILSALFADPTGADGRALVLVGDPKQAIYAFRGADVNAYLTARGDADATQTLAVNHRSDSPVVEAALALFAGQDLGRDIALPPVTAAHPSRIDGLDAPPVLVRVVSDDAPVRRTDAGAMQVTSLRAFVAADVAGQTAALLDAGATVVDPARADGADEDGRRPLGPDDIAVLVRTRHQAVLVQRALARVGITSVLGGVGDVLASPAARDWVHLLRALDRPSSGAAARLAALSPLIGWTPDRVATATDAAWESLHIDLHTWRRMLRTDGVAAMFRHLAGATDLWARLLGRPDGERRLTDLTHVGELLHAHATHEGSGPTGLVAWLEAGMGEAAASSRPVPPDHLATRLERDSGAVRITTVHGAKGLEFGVVLAPFLWDVVGQHPVALRYHDHATGRRRLYVGDSRSDAYHQHKAIHVQQAEQEERRLAYVAVTRARHHLLTWWAPAERAAESPLGALLGRDGAVATADQAVAAVESLAATAPGCVGVETVDALTPVAAVAPPAPTGSRPVLGRFDRTIDRGWRRTSYSRLVGDASAAADAAGVREVDTPPGHAPDDQPDEVVAPAAVVAVHADAAPVPLSDLRGGADVGSMVHAVLERVDFAADDLHGVLRREVAQQAVVHAVDLVGDDGDDGADLVAAARAAAHRPPVAAEGGWCLADLDRRDRIDEMAFELPLLGEDRAEQVDRLLLGDIADLLADHLPAGDPLAGYHVALRRAMGDVELRGFLAGFVDLVARVPRQDPDAAPTFVVCDYKTNRVAPPGTDPLTTAHFSPAAMAAEMQADHYPLQALLYQVALHRYLRWRLTGYDPAVHLDGIAYAFVRGMVGPETPVTDGMRHGVFRWRPPAALITDLDRLLAEGRDPAARSAGGRVR